MSVRKGPKNLGSGLLVTVIRYYAFWQEKSTVYCSTVCPNLGVRSCPRGHKINLINLPLHATRSDLNETICKSHRHMQSTVLGMYEVWWGVAHFKFSVFIFRGYKSSWEPVVNRSVFLCIIMFCNSKTQSITPCTTGKVTHKWHFQKQILIVHPDYLTSHKNWATYSFNTAYLQQWNVVNP